jgi:hypothetical protein
MADCNLTSTQSIEFTFFIFLPYLLVSFSLSSIRSTIHCHNSLSCRGSYPFRLVRHHLVGRRTLSSELTVPLPVVGADEIRAFGLSNQTVRFALFRARASSSYSFQVRIYFGDSDEESTTSSTSSMKGENSDNNGFDLDKGNILKPTFDTLMEEGRKVFEAYYVNLEELFPSCCEVTRQETVLQNITPTVFNKLEVIPEV